MLPTTVYTLYGDGRLVHKRVKEAAKQVRDRVEGRLEFREMEDLVHIAVSAGLAECDTDCIEAKVMDTLGSTKMPQVADGRWVTLTVNLESYQGPGDYASRPRQLRIQLKSPHVLAEFCPELREPKALLEVARALSSHRDAALELDR